MTKQERIQSMAIRYSKDSNGGDISYRLVAAFVSGYLKCEQEHGGWVSMCVSLPPIELKGILTAWVDPNTNEWEHDYATFDGERWVDVNGRPALFDYWMSIPEVEL